MMKGAALYNRKEAEKEAKGEHDEEEDQPTVVTAQTRGGALTNYAHAELDSSSDGDSGSYYSESESESDYSDSEESDPDMVYAENDGYQQSASAITAESVGQALSNVKNHMVPPK